MEANGDEMRNCINDVKQFIKVNEKFNEDEDRLLVFALYLCKTYSWETRKLLAMRLDSMSIQDSIRINYIINESLIMDISTSLI